MTDAKERMHWSTAALIVCCSMFFIGATLVSCAMSGLVPRLFGAISSWVGLIGLCAGVGVSVFTEPYPELMDAVTPWYKPLSRQILFTIWVIISVTAAHWLYGVPPLWLTVVTAASIFVVSISVIAYYFRRELRRREQ